MTAKEIRLPDHLIDLEDLLLDAGVQILLSDATDIAAVTLKEGHAELHVTPRFFTEPPEIQREIVIHELAHLIRGDMLVAQKVGAFESEEKRRAFNIAADALINQTLPELHNSGRFYTYSRLRVTYQDLPGHLPETVWLYNFLLRQNPPDQGGGGGNGDNGDNGGGGENAGDILEPQGDPDANAAGWAATVSRLTQSAQARGVELPAANDPLSGRGAGDAPATGTRQVTPEAVALGAVRRALEHALRRVRQPRAFGGSMKDVRTYRRMRNNLPTYLPRPAARVVLAIDVSGTMMEYYGRVTYIAQKLAREYYVDVLAWSDRAEWVRPPYDKSVTFGGGTLLAPAVDEAAKRRPDAVVIITDDDLHDRDAAYTALHRIGASIVWVIVPPGPCDRGPRPGQVITWRCE